MLPVITPREFPLCKYPLADRRYGGYPRRPPPDMGVDVSDSEKKKRDLFQARRELGNAMRLLHQAHDKLVTVASMLNKAYQAEDEG